MRWLMSLLAIVLLSACSPASSDSSGEPVPQRSAADLATVRAMAGLTDASPTARSARPSPTPKTDVPTATVESRERNPGLASDDSMFDSLITPGDIATTWTRGGYDGFGAASFCGAPAIEDQFEPLGWAYASYAAVSGEWAEQWVVRLSEPDALSAMDYARSTLTCDRYTEDLDTGNDVYFEFEPLDIPPYGDDTYALRVAITFENPAPTPQVGNVVFVRQGEFVVVLFHYGFNTDPLVTARMAELAIARLGLIRDSSV